VVETRRFRESDGHTIGMRRKEDTADYRFLPDPDLPPLRIPPERVAQLQAGLPETWSERRDRYRTLGLSEADASRLSERRRRSDWFEGCRRMGMSPTAAARWMLSDLLEVVRDDRDWERLAVQPAELARLQREVDAGELSLRAARQVLAHMLETGEDSAQAIRSTGLRQQRDPARLAEWVEAALREAPAAAAAYRSGKLEALHALVGEALRHSGGRGDPAALRRLLERRLSP
jgi:aspartyl-tRNA(Asn)/glutamyl-tRNA(Gln) amidotransferase subunit B